MWTQATLWRWGPDPPHQKGPVYDGLSLDQIRMSADVGAITNVGVCGGDAAFWQVILNTWS